MTIQSPLVVASVLFVPVITAVAFAAWVYHDASHRGSDHPLVWALATAAVGVIGFVYLVVRRRVGDRTVPRTSGERAALAAWVTGFLSFVVSSVVAPPDPVTQGQYATGAFVVTLPIVYAAIVRFERI